MREDTLPPKVGFRMHKIVFHPLGNADCILITLANTKDILVDFAEVADPQDSKEKRIQLGPELRRALDGQEQGLF